MALRKPTNLTPRIHWIDLLETVSIIMVVFYHCTAYIGNMSWQNIHTSFYFFYFLRSILSIAVPLFFFVNGYLLFRQPFSLRKHIHKTIRFLLIAIFWYTATITIMAAFRLEQLSFDGILSTIISVKSGINHLWYLGALVCLYLFFPLLKVVYDHRIQVFLYFVAVCLILTFGNSILNELLTIGAQFLGRELIFTETNFFSIFNPLRGVYAFSFVYFCLGGVAYYYRDKIMSFNIKRQNCAAIVSLFVGWLGLFGVGLIYSSATGQVWDNIWYGYSSIWVLLGVLGTWLLSLNWQHQSRIFTYISHNTLGIYLIHMIIIYILNICFNALIMTTLNPVVLAIPFVLVLIGNFIYAIVVFVISLGVSAALRKVPLLKFSIS